MPFMACCRESSPSRYLDASLSLTATCSEIGMPYTYYNVLFTRLDSIRYYRIMRDRHKDNALYLFVRRRLYNLTK